MTSDAWDDGIQWWLRSKTVTGNNLSSKFRATSIARRVHFEAVLDVFLRDCFRFFDLKRDFNCKVMWLDFATIQSGFMPLFEISLCDRRSVEVWHHATTQNHEKSECRNHSKSMGTVAYALNHKLQLLIATHVTKATHFSQMWLNAIKSRHLIIYEWKRRVCK